MFEFKKKEKNVLIIDGHPFGKGLTSDLAKAYEQGALSSYQAVKLLKLSEFEKELFDIKPTKKLESQALDPIRIQIDQANHIVLTYPTWWGGPPAFLKAFFDALFTPGWAFKYKKNESLSYNKLLQGKTGRIMTTMDMNPLVYRLKYSAPGVNLIKKTIFSFCGIRPVGVSIFGSVRKTSEQGRKKWIEQARSLGARGK